MLLSLIEKNEIRIGTVGRWRTFFGRFDSNNGVQEIEEICFFSLEGLERAISEKRIPNDKELVENLRTNIYRYGNVRLAWRGMEHWKKYIFPDSSRRFRKVSLFGKPKKQYKKEENK